MSESEKHYYTVIQEREVKVAAMSPLEAAEIADLVFRAKIDPETDLFNHITIPVREITLHIREDD